MSRNRASAAGPVGALLALAAALVGAGPPGLAAQDDCQWLAPTGDYNREGALNRIRVTTPHLLCRDGVRIRADSARFYDTRDYYELYGNVLYEDADRILRALRAQYYRSTGRLQAQQDIRLTRRSDNALITGENLVYTQGGPADNGVLIVTGGRPHAVLYTTRDTVRGGDVPDEPAGSPPAPWDIDADRIEMEGEDRFDASGDVEIRRDSLEAFADRAVYDTGVGQLTLLGRARMLDAGYALEGDTIDAVLPGDVIEEIVSRRRAVLTGEDLDVRAPLIRMLMSEGTLDRLVAVTHTRDDTTATEPAEPEGELAGAPLPPVTDAALLQAEHPARPVARARDFVIVADSVDVRLPGEVLERLVAVGSAYGESAGRDSLNVEDLPEVARRDWIDGHTIEALFARVTSPDTPEAAAADTVTPPGEPPVTPPEPLDPAEEPAAADTTEARYRLERLTASGSARSLYRMAARDTGAAATEQGPHQPAIHYVVGDTIVLTLEEGAIRTMDVVGQVRGVHWEPVGRPGGTASARRPRPAPEPDERGGT